MIAMTQTPLVSAIVATYNRAHTVGKAIESIIQQTYRNIEIVIVDDGSTDSTLKKLEEFGDKVRVISQKNAGPAAARNRGIEECKGEIVTFLDSDDLWMPTFVEKQVYVMQRVGGDVPCCLSNSRLKFSDGSSSTSFAVALLRFTAEQGLWLNVGEVLATRFVMFTQMAAVRRAALERSGGFDESLWSLEDYDLALKLSFEGAWGFIREPLVIWHQGSSDSLSQKAYADQIRLKQNMIAIRERAFERAGRSKRFRSTRRLLARELKYGHLNLAATRMQSVDAFFPRKIAGLLHLVERARMFGFRRSPWFPKVRLQRVIETEQIGQPAASSCTGVAHLPRKLELASDDVKRQIKD